MGQFEPRVLGKTGMVVGPLGVGSSYGVEGAGIEEAFDRGVNYFYWAWSRRGGMAEGLRTIFKSNRGKAYLSVTSLAPTDTMIRWSVERVLKNLETDYIDSLQFFLFANKKPWGASQLEPALQLQAEGKIRHIGFSSHYRPNFPLFAAENFADICHVRYNAAHPGAETEVFPLLPPKGDPTRPGIVAFTATSWRQLLKVDPGKLSGDPVPTAGDCYRFALTEPGVDVCLTGPSDIAQMRHALDAVDKGPMTADELAWMRRVGAVVAGK